MSDKTMHEIVGRIKKQRAEFGLSYQDVATATGMSKSTLQRYESGAIKNIPLDKLKILANGLQTTVEYIMGWDKISPIITKDQQSLINTYEQLNGEGKQKLTDYGNDLVSSGRYNTDNDIRTYKVAARNGKDTITLTKEQREKMIKLVTEAPEPPDGVY